MINPVSFHAFSFKGLEKKSNGSKNKGLTVTTPAVPRYEKALEGLKIELSHLARGKKGFNESIENVYLLYRGLVNGQKEEALKIISTYAPELTNDIDEKAGLATRKEVFKNIYDNNLWGSKESVSGQGSEIESTKNIVRKLPSLFKKYNVKSIIDAPCGDYNWFKNIDYDLDNYLGVDIVDDLISKVQDTYGDEKTKFKSADILEYKFPKADLILCRDCFIHLSNKEIQNCLKNFKKSGTKYLLTTTSPDVNNNIDIKTANYRKINLCLPPFNLGKPLEVIRDNEKENMYLCLWDL